MIVADASAVVEWLLGGSRGRAAEEHLVADSSRVQVPTLLDAEVLQALRRLVGLGVIDEPRGRASTELLAEMPLERHVLTPLLPRMWELRRNVTAYDAAYLALAEALDCALVTFDAALAGAPGIRARVVVPQVPGG